MPAQEIPLKRELNETHQTVRVPYGTDERFVPTQASTCQALRLNHVRMAGFTDGSPGYLVQRWKPGFHELVYTLAGQGTLSTAKESYPLVPGTLMIAPGILDYQYRALAAKWRFAWFIVADEGPWSAFRSMKAHARPTQWAGEIGHALDRLLVELFADDAGTERMANLLSEQVLLLLERELPSGVTDTNIALRQRLQALWQTVDGRLHWDWTIENLAERAGLSPSHFRRVCTRLLGCSPQEMLTRLRMKRASELLKHYGDPIDEIAEQVSYSSRYAFSAAFKKHFGVAPGAYRRKARNDTP